jgi:UDP-N-acetyl-D-galactosamine dehydrogenase
VADVRNSRVPEVLARLSAAGVELAVHDPRVDPALARRLYGLELVSAAALGELDALFLAVPHRGLAELALELAGGSTRLVLDLSGALERARLPAGVTLWRL